MQLRLLPVAIFAAVLMLGLKLGDLWTGRDGLRVAPSHAQQNTPAAKPKRQPSAAGAAESAPSGEAGAGPAGEADDGLPADPTLYTEAEVDLLQKLSDRRAELEKWSKDLAMREQLLNAAEQRLDEKVAELKTIQEKVQGMLRQYDKEQENKLKSLVKIYETMKPKDAARIFMELEMPILLDLVERMNERRVAPIIAEMKSEKAKQITAELALRRKIGVETAENLPSSRPGNGAR